MIKFASFLLVGLYFQRRREIREQELHEHLLLIDRQEQLNDSLDKKRDL